uniref:Auxin efflux carrier family protein n=1 Tax=Arundo donax TaxID=35708 RepID=A0A0A9AY36_ARUDO
MKRAAPLGTPTPATLLDSPTSPCQWRSEISTYGRIATAS